MPERIELGRRIKKTREALHLTLKAIEAQAGISATHVSEIERGKTSPTVGALLRIAGALEREPAYFLEPEELSEVVVVARESCVRESLPGARGTFERLTTSIPGGRIQAKLIRLAPGKAFRDEPHAHDGEEAILTLSGRVQVRLDDQFHDLAGGDAAHYDASVPHWFSNGSREEETVLLWFATRRGVD